MKKVLLGMIAFALALPLAHANQVVCPSDWQSSFGCHQCFQFYLTEADESFTSDDTFFPRLSLQSDETEVLWLDQTNITAHSMQGANIGPTGNVEHLYSYPGSLGAHSVNGQNHMLFGPEQNQVWAAMNSGSGFVINDLGLNIDPNEPLFRIEYTTVSEVQNNDGTMKSDSTVHHKECAMYMYAGAIENAEIEISVKRNDDGSYDVTVTNVGDVVVDDVYVEHSILPECNGNYGSILVGMSETRTCRPDDNVDGGNNVITAEGRDPDGEPVTDTHNHNTDGEGDLLVTVRPHGGVASGEAGLGGPTYEITVSNIGGGPLNDIEVRTGLSNCDRNYDRLDAGESEVYLCHTPASGPGKYDLDASGRQPDGDLVTYRTTFGDGGNPSDTCRLNASPNAGPAPLDVNASIVCNDPSDLPGKRIYIYDQNGNLIQSYDTYAKMHTFQNPGTYTITCLPMSDSRSSMCRETIRATLSCGNGIVELGEMCDDGNTSNGDGCSSTCRTEMCGNGIIDAGEQCDDGNNLNGDYCTNICQKSTPTTGPADAIFILLGLSLASVGIGTYLRRRAH